MNSDSLSRPEGHASQLFFLVCSSSGPATRSHARPPRSEASAAENIRNNVEDGDDHLEKERVSGLEAGVKRMFSAYSGNGANNGHDNIGNGRDDGVEATTDR